MTALLLRDWRERRGGVQLWLVGAHVAFSPWENRLGLNPARFKYSDRKDEMSRSAR